MRNPIIILTMAMIIGMILSSCAPSQGVSDTKYGPDDPSNKIVTEEDLNKRDLIDGYRIKIASTDTEQDALMVEKQVVEAIQEPVYIEFIIDKYMIYTGDCQNKEEANILKEKLISAGFEKVYSVPKKVFRKSITQTVAVIPDPVNTEAENTASYLPSFDKVIGYRVQIFAAKEKNNAEKVKIMASKDIKERIYIVYAEDNLYKVQVGDYLSKIDADKMRDKIRLLPNYADAFIQNTYVFYDSKASSGDYFIQVGAFSSQNSAEDFIKTSLNSLGYNNTSVYFDKNLYKVLIGSYASNQDAASVKDKLKNDGFEGAWIIQK
ncbi:MAG: SPOR domain-containing protein [Candidatus Delongbacteria bacterium]|nr:SPOR domain-containing protein [Candidatus Delongbacteria bacterium]MCG2761343.1 SPOR domain-containing protein [Candidatus Delongbacteria bacterium]